MDGRGYIFGGGIHLCDIPSTGLEIYLNQESDIDLTSS